MPSNNNFCNPHYVDTLCGESFVLHAKSADVHVQNEDIRPNEIFAQSATPEGLSNLAHRDLHEDINEELTIRADSGGAIKFRIVRDGGNTTSGDVEKNNRHGSGRNSTSGSGIDPGSGNEAGSKIVNIQSNGIPGCEVLTGGNTTNGDANGGSVTATSTSSGSGDVIGANGGKTTNGDANGGNVNVGDAISDSATSTSAM